MWPKKSARAAYIYIIIMSLCDDKSAVEAVGFKIFLRDCSKPMVDAWRDTQAFGCEPFTDSIQVRPCTYTCISIIIITIIQISQGDIFQGAPAADAIVRQAIDILFCDLGLLIRCPQPIAMASWMEGLIWFTRNTLDGRCKLLALYHECLTFVPSPLTTLGRRDYRSF